jgi:hypothetical protein
MLFTRPGAEDVEAMKKKRANRSRILRVLLEI